MENYTENPRKQKGKKNFTIFLAIIAVLLTVAVAGVINAFVIGPVTTTWYQMLFTSKEGTFAVLMWANMLGRVTTKPWVIIACTVLVWIIHRSVYRPVIRQIVQRPAR